MALDIQVSRRRGARLLQGTFEHLVALRQHDDVAAQPFGVRHDVRGKQDRAATIGDTADNLFQALLIDGIEAGKRLVQNDKFGFVNQAGDQLDLLRHALG